MGVLPKRIVKLTKISIEILYFFVYNDFIVVLSTCKQRKDRLPERRMNIPCTLQTRFVMSVCWAIAAAASLPWLRAYFT